MSFVISAHNPRVKAECSTPGIGAIPDTGIVHPFTKPCKKSPSQPRCIQTTGLTSNVLRHFRQQCVNCSSQRASAILPVSHPSGPSILAVPLSSGAAWGGGVEGINLSASILTSLQGFFFFFPPFFQLNGHHPRSNPRGARGVDFLSVCLSVLSDTRARRLLPGHGRVRSPAGLSSSSRSLREPRATWFAVEISFTLLLHLVREAFALVNNVTIT